MIYNGPLGEEAATLIHYFESHGATPIELGENPANWILREMKDDMADAFLMSSEWAKLQEGIEALKSHPEQEKRILYDSEYATPAWHRHRLVATRLQLIYWRSPSYSLSTYVCLFLYLLSPSPLTKFGILASPLKVG
jgi:hypothetical protein